MGETLLGSDSDQGTDHYPLRLFAMSKDQHTPYIQTADLL